MDLAEFDRRIHVGVILDGVGETLFLKRHREALQSEDGEGCNSTVAGVSFSTFVRLQATEHCCSLSMNLQQLKKLCRWMEWQRKQKEKR